MGGVDLSLSSFTKTLRSLLLVTSLKRLNLYISYNIMLSFPTNYKKNSSFSLTWYIIYFRIALLVLVIAQQCKLSKRKTQKKIIIILLCKMINDRNFLFQRSVYKEIRAPMQMDIVDVSTRVVESSAKTRVFFLNFCLLL